MNIYILKFVAAFTNVVVISFVVSYFPNSISSDYMLVLAYTVLGLIIVGIGVELSIERYAATVLARFSKIQLTLLIITVSLLRTILLLAINKALDSVFSVGIEANTVTILFVFSTCLFLTLAALLNGVYMYIESATANVVRGFLRLAVTALPLANVTLPLLLGVEIVAAMVATAYCLLKFRAHKNNGDEPITPFKVIITFMLWNWVARLTSNLSALNTVKILILRSNEPSAVLVAYILQLAQSVENFLPSKVLAGRYRPALARLYDKRQLKILKNELVLLARNNIILSATISLGYIVVVVVIFHFFMANSPANFYYTVLVCSALIFILNAINSLNILSNVIEESHVIFVSSLMMGFCFITGILIFPKNNSYQLITTLFVSTLAYFPIWFFMSRFKIKETFGAT